MPANRILPDNATLMHWVNDEGLTHQQIADRVYTTTGERVSRSTVSAALSRAGLSKGQARYSDEIPWHVSMEHIKEYPARMLRLLGRRRAGNPMTQRETERLDNWLKQIDTDNAVVGYDPDSKFGFYYLEKQEGDGENGIPIRVARIFIND